MTNSVFSSRPLIARLRERYYRSKGLVRSVRRNVAEDVKRIIHDPMLLIRRGPRAALRRGKVFVDLFEDIHLPTINFDSDVAKFDDIQSMIAYHDLRKLSCGRRFRSLYDLRSGIIFSMLSTCVDVYAHYRRLAEDEPEDFPPLRLLGTTAGGGDFDEKAAAYLTEAIRRSPRLAEAHYHLARILRRQGDVEGAIAAFREAARHKPGVARGRNDISIKARAQFECGLILESVGRHDAAIECFSAATRAAREFGPAHRALAMGLLRRGETSRAAGSFSKAMSYRPIFSDLPALPKGLWPMPYGAGAGADKGSTEAKP